NGWALWRYRRAVGAYRTAARRGCPSTMGGAGSRTANLDPSEITNQEREGPRRTPVRAIHGRTGAPRPARAKLLFFARNQTVPEIQSSKTPAGSALGGDGVAPSRFASDLRIWDGPARRCTSCRR